MNEPLNENLLEQLYWDFDNERYKGNISERDIFKHKMRYFAKYHQPTKPIICSFCGLERTEEYCRCGNEELSEEMVKKFKALYMNKDFTNVRFE